MFEESEFDIVKFPLCPHCGTTNVAFYYNKNCIQQTQEGYVFLLLCGHCNHGVCAEMNTTESLISYAGFTYDMFNNIFPEPKPINAPKYTPDNIVASYKTALINLRRGDDADYEACCIMARRCIEMAVKDKDGHGSNLHAQIENLAQRQIITPTLKDWAHEIRILGNKSAHGDITTKEDAEQIVYFAEMLCTYLYTLPCMITKRRLNHTNTK